MNHQRREVACPLSSETPSGQEDSVHVIDESQLATNIPEDLDLRDLNNLGPLAAIFLDVQVEVFREMLSSFDEESL
jgi:hypothetical protein